MWWQRLARVAESVALDSYDRFRALLIAARKRAGVTQEELAARLRRPQSYVSKSERGERRLDVVEFVEISLALGLDPTELLREYVTERVTGKPRDEGA